MAFAVTVPRLGWSMDQGTFVRWLKRSGDPVRPGEPLFELESEKAVQEIEALDAGRLCIPSDAPAPGTVVDVGAVIGFLLADDESPLPSCQDYQPETPGGVAPSSDLSSAALPASTGPSSGGEPSSVERPRERRLRSTPRARRIAAEIGVNWTTLTGSGRGGRIRECDVRSAAQAQPTETVPQGASLRSTIARRMATSRDRTVPVTLTTRGDASHLVSLRNKYKDASGKSRDAIVPTFTDLLAYRVARVLRDYPTLNSRWDGERIVQFDDIHLGIAVDTERGLVVPVIHHAHRLDLRELSRRARELAERARLGTCTPSELSGGTFTITNLGHLGIDAFTPVINYPEVAILGLGAIRHEAHLLDEGGFLPRQVLTLSLTFDHQVLDGAPAARFLQAVVKSLEAPAASHLDV